MEEKQMEGYTVKFFLKATWRKLRFYRMLLFTVKWTPKWWIYDHWYLRRENTTPFIKYSHQKSEPESKQVSEIQLSFAQNTVAGANKQQHKDTISKI